MGKTINDQADQSGLLFRVNRYIDPVTGTFTQADPIGVAGGLNVYGYVGGDPVNFSDPLGLCPEGSFLCNLFESGVTALGTSIGFIVGGGGGTALAVGTGGLGAAAVPAGAAEGAALGGAAGLALAKTLSPFFFSKSDGGEVRRKPGKLGEFKGRDALRRENKMVRDVVKELKLTRDQRTQLHQDISGEGLDYQGILKRAQDLFGGGS